MTAASGVVFIARCCESWTAGRRCMRLMYVFDPREASGRVMRVPEFVARAVTSRPVTRVLHRCWDYAPTKDGF